MSALASAPAPRRLTEVEARSLQAVLRGVACKLAAADVTLAADLVQETLLAVHEGIGSFDGRSELRTWAVGILSHKAVDAFRRARRWEPLDLDDPADPRLLTPGGRTPESAASDRQALDVLSRALSALPDRERLAVVLCDVEGMDRDEVCNVLDVRATNLRVLLHRARHRLRKALEDADV